jgi:5-methyltetrahydrofolate--homocysteine methyltransferase
LLIVVTMTFDTRGRTMMGVTPEQAIQTLTPMNLTAIGGNCGNGIDEIVGVMQKMSATGRPSR